jgi:hypothetical protein
MGAKLYPLLCLFDAGEQVHPIITMDSLIAMYEQR